MAIKIHDWNVEKRDNFAAWRRECGYFELSYS